MNLKSCLKNAQGSLGKIGKDFHPREARTLLRFPHLLSNYTDRQAGSTIASFNAPRMPFEVQ